MGAGLVLTGEVRRLDSALVADLKLHDARKGSLLAAESYRAPDGLALLDATGPATERLLAVGFEAFFGKPVLALKSGGAREKAPKGPGWWSRNVRSPGWNVGAVLDQQLFVASDSPDRGSSGAHATLRAGWGPFGLQAGGWMPGALPAFGVDVLRDTGVALRTMGAWQLSWLLPDLALRYVPAIDLPKNGFAPAERARAFFASTSLTGLSLRSRHTFVSVRGPGLSFMRFWSPGEPTPAQAWALSLGGAVAAGYVF